MMGLNGAGNNLHRGTRAADAPGGISACPLDQNAPAGVLPPPADLQAFVQTQTVTEVANVLGMSRKSAWRLRSGHWPRDTRSVLGAWEAYKGRSAQQQSNWFLRRVHSGGLVRHAGLDWTAPGLAMRTGQTLAVARAVGQALLAQTLELPPLRLELAPVADIAGAA